MDVRQKRTTFQTAGCVILKERNNSNLHKWTVRFCTVLNAKQDYCVICVATQVLHHTMKHTIKTIYYVGNNQNDI